MSEIFQGAWRTVVPAPGDRHGPLAPLLLILTLVTGFVDSFSYIELGHVFVANMTGNVVFAGFAIGGTTGFSLWASLAALVAFAGGALIGGRIALRLRAHRGRVLFRALLVQTTLVVAAYLVAEFTENQLAAGVRYPLIVLLGLAMGVQNAAARSLAVPDLTTTVLTMTITGVSADSRAAGGTGGKTGRRILSLLVMFLGAFLGALAIRHGHPSLSLLSAALLLVVAALVAARTRRSDDPWTKPLG